MSNIQTGAERMPHDLSHLGFLAGQIGRLITISTTPDRKSGSAGMPRPISYAVFCLKKKKKTTQNIEFACRDVPVEALPSWLATPQDVRSDRVGSAVRASH